MITTSESEYFKLVNGVPVRDMSLKMGKGLVSEKSSLLKDDGRVNVWRFESVGLLESEICFSRL